MNVSPSGDLRKKSATSEKYVLIIKIYINISQHELRHNALIFFPAHDKIYGFVRFYGFKGRFQNIFILFFFLS